MKKNDQNDQNEIGKRDEISFYDGWLIFFVPLSLSISSHFSFSISSHHHKKIKKLVHLNLNQPISTICEILSSYPIKTRLRWEIFRKWVIKDKIYEIRYDKIRW